MSAILPGRRMARDTVWNFAALAATAGAGGAVVLVIASRMAADALGVFAQLYAVHVIAAQAAVWGVHDSTQKFTAEAAGRGEPDGPIVSAGVMLVAVSASILALLLAALSPAAGWFTNSDAVARGLLLVAPGIVCFAINKVLFGALNGRTSLRAYASLQILRAAFVLAAAALVAGRRLPSHATGAIFTAAESALLPCLWFIVKPLAAASTIDRHAWVRRHRRFGGRGVVNAILLETHLRVDVITLGYFVDDRAVGAYAFAMLFAEAVYQIPVVIRTVSYPTMVRLAASGSRLPLARAARRLSVTGGAACALGALAVLIGYPFVAAWFAPAFLAEGVRVLPVLLLGMTLYAFFVPFDQVLLQSGQPGRQSLLMAAYVGVNVVLNIALIPRFGIQGAAIATAMALAAAGAMLLAASWRWLGLRGGILFYSERAA